MAVQFDQYDYSGSGAYGQNQPAGNKKPLAKLVIGAVCLLAVALTAWSLISAVNEKNRTGTIAVTVSDPSAQIKIIEPNAEPVEAGSGNVTVRVEPGNYTVLAIAGNKQTLKTVSVTQQVQTAVDLVLEDAKPLDKIANYSAANALATTNSVYFLNTDDRVPYSLRFGETVGKPFATSLYPTDRISWVSPSSFFILKNQVWSHVSSKGTVELQTDQEMPDNPDAVSFNGNGGYAYITNNKNVLLGGSPTASPKRITSVPDSDYKLSLAANNSLLIYSVTRADTSKKTRLLQGNKLRDLGSLPAGIQNAEWAPGGGRFSYVTGGGLYIYDTATNQSTQVLSGNITDTEAQVWLNDKTLVFAQDQTVWKYGTDTGATVKLAAVEGRLPSFRPLSISGNGATLYFGTTKDDQGKGGALYRVVLGQGQQSSPPPAATPEASAFSGFSALTNRGMTVDQLNNVQYAIERYVRSKRPNTRNISVPVDGVQPTTRNIGDEFSTVNFALMLDSARYKARVNYAGISEVRVYLYDSKGQLVYDSGKIKT